MAIVHGALHAGMIDVLITDADDRPRVFWRGAIPLNSRIAKSTRTKHLLRTSSTAQQ